jgi:hypothetical protein
MIVALWHFEKDEIRIRTVYKEMDFTLWFLGFDDLIRVLKFLSLIMSVD